MEAPSGGNNSIRSCLLKAAKTSGALRSNFNPNRGRFAQRGAWGRTEIHRRTKVRGKVTEHIVPYLPGFNLDPKDVRFLGTPIDLIAFDGLNASEEVEIVFIEVKTGQSALSPRERAVKNAVEARRVSWRVFNPDLEVGRPLARVPPRQS
jgi:hypothetical protein